MGKREGFYGGGVCLSSREGVFMAVGHGPPSWLQKLPLLPHDSQFVHVNGAIVVFLFILVFAIIANRRIRNKIDNYIVPSSRFSLVNVVDLIVEALYKMIASVLGDKTKKYFPFIAAMFLFVFFSNLLGLTPLGSAPTSVTSTTYALGIASFVYYNLMGIKAHGLVGYVKHFTMGLGLAGVVVALLELISHMVRPISLGIRLCANMFADHTLSLSFMELFAWLLPVPLLLFGVVVCTVQAFVFAMLTAVYVQMAVEH